MMGGYELGRGLVVVKRFDWTVVEELASEFAQMCQVTRGR
jgi:hypothetical protein